MEKYIIHEIINKAKAYSDKIAIVQGNTKVSYGELDRQSSTRAFWMKEKGVRPGDIVGVLVSNHLDFIINIIAILKLTAVAAPLSKYYQANDLRRLTNSANIKLVITDTENSYKLSDASIDLCIYDNKQLAGHEAVNAKISSMGVVETEIKPNDPVLFLMTSGSTGSPKIASISQAAMKERLDVELNTFDLNLDDRIMISTPLYHSLAMRMILTALYSGMTLIVLKGFTAYNWVSTVESERVTYTISVPVQLQAIADYCEGNGVKNELDSIKTLLSTSAPLPPAVRDRIIPYIKGRFYNFIASSETEFIAKIDCKEERRDDVLGFPFPGVTIKIKCDGKKHLGYNTGEILCRSEELFTEYYNDKGLTLEKFEQGYFCTGDRGYIDETGCLYHAGRKKNIIICSGVNIYPEDIEKEVLRHDKVKDCYVCGAPDSRCGEKIVLFVSGKDLNERELKAFCLSNLSIHQQPRIIKILNEIPRDDLGKIRKGEILKWI